LAYKFDANLYEITSPELHAVKISAKSHFRGTIMKRDIFRRLAVSVLLVATPLSIASAADLPLKSPLPSPMPVASWTGCYIGGNAGEA
jgi:hypothetical protein